MQLFISTAKRAMRIRAEANALSVTTTALGSRKMAQSLVPRTRSFDMLKADYLRSSARS